MKKNIKKISVLIVIIISLILFLPSNILALSKELSFATINNTEKIEVGDLSFYDISFKDYSLESVKAFGLNGKVVNTSKNTINYRSEIYYYDANYNIIAEGYSLGMAISGTSDYNQMSNLSILNGHSISEIHYYSLSIQILNNETIVKPSESNIYASYDYVIDKYDINIVVNENNTFDITEKITAYFNTQKHGIIRTIPLRNEITRLDGSRSRNRTQITNLNVSDNYKITRQNGNYGIKIGSEDRTLIGEKEYIISYTYNLGKDPMKNYDEIYYNIIGNNWDTVIGNITFTVTMPKEFDSSKLGFSYGTVGSTDNSNIKYNVSGNTIIGSYEGILNANEALTIRCELPEGYFVGAGLVSNTKIYSLLLIPLVFLGIAILLWYKFGRDDIIVETVEFYPPEGVNSLDAGFMYNGKATNKDVTSLLVYLANKGYIEITNLDFESELDDVTLDSSSINLKINELQNKINEEKIKNPESEKIKYFEDVLGIYKKANKSGNYKKSSLKRLIKKAHKGNKFLISKLKNYDGIDNNERRFMKGLFKNNRKEVTDKELNGSFYMTYYKILRSVNKKGNINKIIEPINMIYKTIIILMIIFTYLIITILPLYFFEQLEAILMIILISLPGFALMLYALFNKTGLDRFGLSLMGLIIGSSPWCLFALPAIIDDRLCALGYIVGVICIFVMMYLMKTPKRTKYEKKMLGKLKGFKNFLETAEKEKLEALVLKNPNYFYDILPYTYVLNVSDKWIEKFETMSLEAPSWYVNHGNFDISDFGRFMDFANSSVQQGTSANSLGNSSSSGSSFSGGSSGGGSSGGGSGGGGGSSW